MQGINIISGKAEQPIKDGIKVFDDLKREKRKTSIRTYRRSCNRTKLNEKICIKT